MPIIVGIAAFIAGLLISYALFPLAGSGANDYMLHRLAFTAVVTAIASVVANNVEKDRLRGRKAAEEVRGRQDQSREELRRRAEKEAGEARRQAAIAVEQQARSTASRDAERRVAHLRELQRLSEQRPCETGPDQQRYKFGVVADEVLAASLWDHLGTPSSERTTITAEQLSRMNGTLEISGLLKSQQLLDLEGLQYATNLEAIELSFVNQLRSVRPIAGLRKLRRLKIWNAALTDLDALACMEGLQELELGYLKEVADFRPLAGLSSLRRFHASGMSDSLEFDSASGLTGFTTLILSDMRHFSDLRGLSGLRQLSEVTLWDIGAVDDLSPLAQLTRLRKLVIDGIWIKGLHQLAEIQSLTFLALRDVSGVKDLRGIGHLRRLKELEIEHVMLEYLEQGTIDLGPLANLKSLTRLKLVEKEYEGSFVGLDAIVELSALTALEVSSYLDDRQIEMISRLTGLKSLALESALLGRLGPLASLAQLESLSLKGKFIEGPTNLYELRKLVALPRLASLTLDTLEDFMLLNTVSEFTGLTELKLRELWLDSGGEGLGPLARLTNLKTLELRDNYRLIPDLTPLASLHELRSLTLSGRGMRDWDTRPLTGLPNLVIRGPGQRL